MEKDAGQQQVVEVTGSQWSKDRAGQPKAFRKFSVKSIYPYVCGAVIHLRDSKGSSSGQILDYLKSESIVLDSHAPLIDGALKKAVKRKMLKEQSEGKFKLAKGDCQTIEMLLREQCCNAACRRRNASKSVKKKHRGGSCGKRKPCRRRSRPRKKCNSRKQKLRRPCHPKPCIPLRCRRKKACDGESIGDGSTTIILSETLSDDDSHWNRSF